MESSSAPPGGSGKHYTWPELTLACMLCRNDIDRVGVRAGCNLTMWAGDDYTGQDRSWSQPHRLDIRLCSYSECQLCCHAGGWYCRIVWTMPACMRTSTLCTALATPTTGQRGTPTQRGELCRRGMMPIHITLHMIYTLLTNSTYNNTCLEFGTGQPY